jgi:hypothetical protein
MTSTSEKLREVHGLNVCRETVRRLRLRHGLAAVRPTRFAFWA